MLDWLLFFGRQGIWDVEDNLIYLVIRFQTLLSVFIDIRFPSSSLCIFINK